MAGYKMFLDRFIPEKVPDEQYTPSHQFHV